MKSKAYDMLDAFVDELPVISSHEHHLPDDLQKDLSLDKLLLHSYLSWYTDSGNGPKPYPDYRKKYHLPQDHPGKDPYLAREVFLEQFASNTYWVWLEKAIQAIYQLNDRISAENWDQISHKISESYKDPAHHLRVLSDTGRYLRAIQDSYWNYASNLGHPELFSPTIRTDMFVMSSHESMRDADQNSPFSIYPDIPANNFDDYLDFVNALYEGWRNKGAVAMKCAVAYERPIDFNKVSKKRAGEIFGKPSDQINDQDRRAYGDFMFNWFCTLAKQLELPFQIHTGLGDLSGSNPMLLVPAIERHPGTRFVLFHAGFPWQAEMAGIAHNYRNVIVDMVWVPLISTSAAITGLNTFLDVTTSDAIGWGGDTWTSEEAVGATFAWKYVVKSVLSERVDKGLSDLQQARKLAERLLFKNNADLYGFAISGTYLK